MSPCDTIIVHAPCAKNVPNSVGSSHAVVSRRVRSFPRGPRTRVRAEATCGDRRLDEPHPRCVSSISRRLAPRWLWRHCSECRTVPRGHSNNSSERPSHCPLAITKSKPPSRRHPSLIAIKRRSNRGHRRHVSGHSSPPSSRTSPCVSPDRSHPHRSAQQVILRSDRDRPITGHHF